MKREPWMNPRNVTETVATCYLTASGWTRDLFSYDEERWIRNGLKLTRAKALLKTYDDDITRLVFVAQHASLDTISMLAPAAVMEWLEASLPKWFDVELPRHLETHKEAVAKWAGAIVAAGNEYNTEAQPGNGSVAPVRRDVAALTLAVAELQRQVEELQGDVYRLRNGGK